MTKISEAKNIKDILAMADRTISRLEQMALIVSQHNGSACEHETDIESTERCLMVANAALRRWRLEMGLHEGVCSLNMPAEVCD